MGLAGLHAGAGHVDDVTEPAFAPVRQQRQHHAHRAEVVDRHHPFVVVQPVGGVDHRAADRAAGVVHQVVDVAEAAQDVFDGVLHRRGIGDIAGEGMRLTAVGADLGDQIVERVAVARQREHASAALGDRDRRGPADTAGCAGDDDVPAHQRPARIVATRAIRVEMLGPVPPQPGRVASRTRARQFRCRCNAFRVLSADEGGRQVDDVEDLGRDPQLGGRHVAQHLGAPAHLQQRGGHRAGQRSAQRRQPGRFRDCRGRCRAAQWFSARSGGTSGRRGRRRASSATSASAT